MSQAKAAVWVFIYQYIQRPSQATTQGDHADSKQSYGKIRHRYLPNNPQAIPKVWVVWQNVVSYLDDFSAPLLKSLLQQKGFQRGIKRLSNALQYNRTAKPHAVFKNPQKVLVAQFNNV